MRFGGGEARLSAVRGAERERALLREHDTNGVHGFLAVIIQPLEIVEFGRLRDLVGASERPVEEHVTAREHTPAVTRNE